jgi:Fe2+ or Zn2+ uptake regulation protein
MSIERNGIAYTLTCDNCGYEHDDEFDDFDDAVAAKREDGWKSRKVNGEWEDWCPDCVENEARP